MPQPSVPAPQPQALPHERAAADCTSRGAPGAPDLLTTLSSNPPFLEQDRCAADIQFHQTQRHTNHTSISSSKVENQVQEEDQVQPEEVVVEAANSAGDIQVILIHHDHTKYPVQDQPASDRARGARSACSAHPTMCEWTNRPGVHPTSISPRPAGRDPGYDGPQAHHLKMQRTAACAEM